MPMIACPGCTARLKVGDEFVGKALACPRCSTPFRVPQPRKASNPVLDLPAPLAPTVAHSRNPPPVRRTSASQPTPPPAPPPPPPPSPPPKVAKVPPSMELDTPPPAKATIRVLGQNRLPTTPESAAKPPEQKPLPSDEPKKLFADFEVVKEEEVEYDELELVPEEDDIEEVLPVDDAEPPRSRRR